MQSKCTHTDCNKTAGFVIEATAEGVKVLKFKTRHNGEVHQQQIPISEIVRLAAETPTK